MRTTHWWAGLGLVLSTAAHAAELDLGPLTTDGSEASEEAPPVDPPPTDEEAEGPDAILDAPELLEGLSKKEYRFLKPKRHLLPANPDGQTGFTAYTLEFGEVRIGLAQTTVGVAPRVQLGTVPLLNAVGVYNAQVKANPVRFGPVDLSALGSAYYLPLGSFQGLLLGGGGMASVKLGRALSLHAGAEYRHAFAQGVPTKLPPLVTAFVDTSTAEDLLGQVNSVVGGSSASGDVVTVRAAIDLRLNRRDSIVIQGQAVTWARGTASLDVASNSAGAATLVGLDDNTVSVEEQLDLSQTYMVTASWQLSWKQLDLRVGGGASAVPYLWAVQANDVGYRFGGKTRREDARRKKGWRTNRKDVVGSKGYEVEVFYEDPPEVDGPVIDLTPGGPEATPSSEGVPDAGAAPAPLPKEALEAPVEASPETEPVEEPPEAPPADAIEADEDASAEVDEIG